jgi:hypothetical protein
VIARVRPVALLQVYTSTGTHLARAIGGPKDTREYFYPCGVAFLGLVANLSG